LSESAFRFQAALNDAGLVPASNLAWLIGWHGPGSAARSRESAASASGIANPAMHAWNKSA